MYFLCIKMRCFWYSVWWEDKCSLKQYYFITENIIWNVPNTKCIALSDPRRPKNVWWNIGQGFTIKGRPLINYKHILMLSGPPPRFFSCNPQWKCIGGLTPPPPPPGWYIINGGALTSGGDCNIKMPGCVFVICKHTHFKWHLEL